MNIFKRLLLKLMDVCHLEIDNNSPEDPWKAPYIKESNNLKKKGGVK
jgi:hypothetical protein